MLAQSATNSRNIRVTWLTYLRMLHMHHTPYHLPWLVLIGRSTLDGLLMDPSSPWRRLSAREPTKISIFTSWNPWATWDTATSQLLLPPAATTFTTMDAASWAPRCPVEARLTTTKDRLLPTRSVTGSDFTTHSKVDAAEPETLFPIPPPKLRLRLDAQLDVIHAPALELTPSTTTWITLMSEKFLFLLRKFPLTLIQLLLRGIHPWPSQPNQQLLDHLPCFMFGLLSSISLTTNQYLPDWSYCWPWRKGKFALGCCRGSWNYSVNKGIQKFL